MVLAHHIYFAIHSATYTAAFCAGSGFIADNLNIAFS